MWEQEVDVIAMLTAFHELCSCLCVCDLCVQELGKQKCFMYWPQETGPQHIHKYGDVS